MKNRTLLCFLLFYLIGPGIEGAQAQVIVYADAGRNDSLQNFARILNEQLNKSLTGTIDTRSKDLFRGTGIYLSNISYGKQYVKPSAKLRVSGPEAFSISADGRSVRILGNSDMAVGHGIFAWLESLGFRYYFANPDWHIVPSRPVLYRKQSILSKPALQQRKLFYGYGTGSARADADFVFWQMANRMGGSLNAIYGHSYDNIMLRNAAVFREHPEYFYPVPEKGKLPGEPKFDMSNEGLVQVVIRDVINQIETSLKNKTQSYKMITLGPSDGPGTCNSPACQKLGTISDRVYYLVNRAAKAIQTKYPDSKIGCLAYSEYIAPPTIRLEPNIYVAITTAFNNSKYTTPQLVKEWTKKGVSVGLYDYFSWYAWDYDIPGQSQASRPFKVAENIRRYQKLGVRGYDAESSIGWVSKGLGYYTAAKVMWDPNTDVGAIRKEFFEKCFGKAASSIRKLWDEWEDYGFTQVRESDLARWIDRVFDAARLETDAAVQKRFFQIKSYLHWLQLYRQYQASKTEANMLALLSFGFRKLDDGSVSGYPAFFEIGNRSGIAGMGWGPDAKWRSNRNPVTAAELDNLLRQERAGLKISQPVKTYKTTAQLKNVPSWKSYAALIADSNHIDNAFWLVDEWVILVKNKGKANYIDFTGDFLGDKTNPQPIRINIYPYSADGNVSGLEPVFSYDYTAQKVKERLRLDQLAAGYYTMVIQDPVKVYRLTFSPEMNYSVVMRPSGHIKTTSLNYAFIYVPGGVKKFNVIKSRTVQFITPTGRKVDLVNDKEEDIQVDVKEGENGLWRIKLLSDRMFIEGIPPYIGISPGQMLIPGDNR